MLLLAVCHIQHAYACGPTAMLQATSLLLLLAECSCGLKQARLKSHFVVECSKPLCWCYRGMFTMWAVSTGGGCGLGWAGLDSVSLRWGHLARPPRRHLGCRRPVGAAHRFQVSCLFDVIDKCNCDAIQGTSGVTSQYKCDASQVRETVI